MKKESGCDDRKRTAMRQSACVACPNVGRRSLTRGVAARRCYTMSAQCWRRSEVGGLAMAKLPRYWTRIAAGGSMSAAMDQSRMATTTGIGSSTVDFWTVSILPSFFSQLQ